VVSLNYDIAYTQLTFHIQNNLTITLFFITYANHTLCGILQQSSGELLRTCKYPKTTFVIQAYGEKSQKDRTNG